MDSPLASRGSRASAGWVGIARRDLLTIAAFLAAGVPGLARAAEPQGQLVWGVHISLAPSWFDPAETPFMELDHKKRAAILQKMQQLASEQAIYAPIWLLGFLNGVGPRVGQSRFGLIPGFAYTAPYEDITVKS